MCSGVRAVTVIWLSYSGQHFRVSSLFLFERCQVSNARSSPHTYLLLIYRLPSLSYVSFPDDVIVDI